MPPTAILRCSAAAHPRMNNLRPRTCPFMPSSEISPLLSWACTRESYRRCATTCQGAGSWLFPLVNGAPPIGWHDASAYLVLPVLLIVSQYVSQKIISPPSNDPSQQSTQWILKFLPLMIGGSWDLPLSLFLTACVLHINGTSKLFRESSCNNERAVWGAGWFSLNVPSGLTIYWFINNVLSTAQQVSALYQPVYSKTEVHKYLTVNCTISQR